ncbi:MAG: Hsp33 family molecular chaperone, partial [Alphaproteobacteria bacterium]
MPFQVDALDTRGRIARLGPAVTAIVGRHAYPPPVSRLLGEAVALAALIASNLKFEGRMILQAQTDGPVRLVVADVRTPNQIRALARFDDKRVAEAVAAGAASPAELLGSGQLVLTIDQGSDMQRYQGIVLLEGQGLEAAADTYFRQSEQIPTRIRLAAAEIVVPGEPGSSWRAGGIMIQHLPAGGLARPIDLDPGDAPEGFVSQAHADQWVEARALADTVADDELVDPSVTPEVLLYRLFHEQGVRVFDAMDIHDHCTCSRDRIAEVVRSFEPDERRDMLQDGMITVTCEYCSTRYD